MKINQKVVYLLTAFTFLLVFASNVAVVDAVGAGKLTKVASNVEFDGYSRYSIPTWSPNGNDILFSRNSGLYKVSSDGSGEKMLSKGSINYYYKWSPDGKKILFTKDAVNYETDLYTVLSDGSAEKKLAPVCPWAPRWSPDGSKISYDQTSTDGNDYSLWIMNADGTKKTQLLENYSSGALFWYDYTWFPLSSKIAYIEGFDNLGLNLYVINSDGSNKQQISNGGNGDEIEVSPDESKIAYQNLDDDPLDNGKYDQIYVQNLNQNTQITFRGRDFSWFPDSSKLVYCSNENGHNDIYTIKAGGTGKIQLTSDSSNDTSSIISPDGSKILYMSDKTGSSGIWVMDADGKNKVQLTTDTTDSSPVWCPDGKKIAFYSARGGDHAIYVLSLVDNSLKVPIAAFSATPTAGNVPLTVKFTDTSTGSPTAWKWNFGDGTPIITAYNPTHTYTKAGVYTVKETVTNAVGKDTAIKTNYITVKASKPPVAAFSAIPTTGTAPLKLTFADQSTGSPTSWLWNFGDGNTSTAQNPTHTYSKAGKYSIVLTATNAAGSNTVTKSNYIVVTALKPPVAAFTATPLSGKKPLTVSFTDKSTNNPTSWSWVFGDGTSSTTKNPVHKYTKAGTYTVKLTVKNAAGSSSVTKSKYITVK